MDPASAMIASGGMSFYSNLFGNWARQREAKKQRKFDKEMWHLQNAYNTPLMQMQRLRDAGLNPALMYSQGNPGNAMGQVKATVPQITNPIDPGSIASGVQLSLADQQRKLLRSQQIKNLQDAASGKATENRINTLVGLEAQSMEWSIKNQGETFKEIGSRILLNEAKAKLDYSQIELNQVRKKLDEAKIDLTDAQEAKVYVEIKAIGEQVAQGWLNAYSNQRQASNAQRQALAAEAANRIKERLGEMGIKAQRRGQTMQFISSIVGSIFGLAPSQVITTRN